jgi:hypothetical protein
MPLTSITKRKMVFGSLQRGFFRHFFTGTGYGGFFSLIPVWIAAEGIFQTFFLQAPDKAVFLALYLFGSLQRGFFRLSGNPGNY